jgi:hypothetical protein
VTERTRSLALPREHPDRHVRDYPALVSLRSLAAMTS